MEDLVLNKRKILHVLSPTCALLLTALAGQRLLTGTINLGELRFELSRNVPNPGSIKCSKALALATGNNRIRPWFVVRWGNRSGDYRIENVVTYSRPTGSLKIWSRNISGWASRIDGWEIAREFQHVTDAKIARVAESNQGIHRGAQFGAWEKNPPKRRR